jgi:hypothetical protein
MQLSSHRPLDCWGRSLLLWCGPEIFQGSKCISRASSNDCGRNASLSANDLALHDQRHLIQSTHVYESLTRARQRFRLDVVIIDRCRLDLTQPDQPPHIAQRHLKEVGGLVSLDRQPLCGTHRPPIHSRLTGSRAGEPGHSSS